MHIWALPFEVYNCARLRIVQLCYVELIYQGFFFMQYLHIELNFANRIAYLTSMFQ